MQTYFDNAATSYPKPGVVLEATIDFLQECGASPGRGAYDQAKEASKTDKPAADGDKKEGEDKKPAEEKK